MASPVLIDLDAPRNVWFIDKRAWLGRDFTGYSFKMQVRLVKDTTGTPLLDMGTANPAVDPKGIALLYAGTDTITNHIAAGRLGSVPAATNPATGTLYQATDSVLLSQIEIFIEDTLVRGLPFPPERGDDLVLYYDLAILPGSGADELIQAGKFTVLAGVTIP